MYTEVLLNFGGKKQKGGAEAVWKELKEAVVERAEQHLTEKGGNHMLKQ